MVRDHNLNPIAAATRAFIEADSSERIKRALRHNLRSSNNKKHYSGESIHYKRVDSKKWRGPRKVIGQDGQQVFIKHGGVYVSTPCRVMHEKRSYYKPLQKDTSEVSENDSVNYEFDIEDFPNIHIEYMYWIKR